MCFLIPLRPSLSLSFHKHFRRDKKTLCNMIVCGKEVRDGCPELHEGINARSLMRMEQAELRDNIMMQRREALARQSLAHQRALVQVPGLPVPSAGSVPVPPGNAFVGALGAQELEMLQAASSAGGFDAKRMSAQKVDIQNGQEAQQQRLQQDKEQSLSTETGIAPPVGTGNQPGAPQVLGPNGQPINSGPSSLASQNQFPPILPPFPASAPIPGPANAGPGAPMRSLPYSLPVGDGSLAAMVDNSDPADVQARIDAMQARILELKRRQLAELEAKHAELQLLEAEEQVRIRRQNAAAEGARAEAFEEQLRLRQENMMGIGAGAHPPAMLPPVAGDTKNGNALGIPVATGPSFADPAPAARVNGEATREMSLTQAPVEAPGPQVQVAPSERVEAASTSALTVQVENPPSNTTGIDASVNGHFCTNQAPSTATTAAADTDFAASSQGQGDTGTLPSTSMTLAEDDPVAFEVAANTCTGDALQATI